jgi:hypothetical protein
VNTNSAPSLSFFCELDGASLAALFSDPQVIPMLEKLRASVNLGVIDFSPQRVDVVKRLNQAKIPVVAWQLLPQEQGYWYHGCNAKEAFAHYEKFISWSTDNNLQWAGIGMDIEPDIQEFQSLLLDKKNLLKSIRRRGCGKARLREVQAEYRQLVQRMREDGFVVDSYEFPFMIDEYWAGSTILQRLTGMVETPADRRVVMLYTSFFRPIGQGVLWHYARRAEAVAVGITGGGVEIPGVQPPPPMDWDEFSRDLRLAKQRTNDIHIFSLEGCVEQDFMSEIASFDWNHETKPVHPWHELAMLARLIIRGALWASARPLVVVGLLVLLLWVLL